MVLCFLLLWSSRVFFDYGQLSYRLAGKSRLERGYIGSNEWQSFLARAGRPELRKAMAGAQEKNAGSSVADGWAWVTGAEGQLPPDAKVYLNVPDILLFYFSTSLWFPRRVDVDTQPSIIKDGDALANVFKEAAWRLDPLRLDGLQLEAARAGYTHLVTNKAGALVILPLRGETGGGAR